MKRWFGKSKKAARGMPSAVLLSILIHAGLFLLAGMLVVFTVVKKEEKQFEPPKAVERPKMKLKKPKVRLKKSSRPKSTTRIVTRANRATMPNIELPEMSGMGDGVGDGIGAGFDMMPDLGEITIFGGGQTIGNDFEGTLYDFKRRRNGGQTGIDHTGFLYELAKFTKGGWNPSRLAQYYQSPKKLYTTHFMIPTISSDIAPTAFGEPDMMGYAWAVHYKGQIVHPTGGTFRFWAQGDDVIIVLLDGEVVVNGSVSQFRPILSNYINTAADSMKYYMGERCAEVGKWFTLEAGVPLDMEVVIGESPGGSFAAMLAVQEEGVEYPKSPQGGPLLPMFKTEEPTHEILDSIYEHLIPGEVSCTSGPIFRDYASGASERGKEGAAEVPQPKQNSVPGQEEPDESQVRMWSGINGKYMEGEYVCTIGDKVVLKTAKGREVKVPCEQLSMEDIEYIELSNPPEFSVDFRAKSKQRLISKRNASAGNIPSVVQWSFGVKVKQTSAGVYNHELNVEYFAIGQQVIDADKFILLDRGSDCFTPGKQNARSHEFISNRFLELMKYTIAGQEMGREKAGYLVVIRDKRGDIIQYQTSNEWLWDNFDRLKQLPVGAFMDRSCNRVYPTGPKATRY